MHHKILNAFKLLNMLFQGFYTLALPIGVGAVASFLLTKYASAPSFIWAIFLTLGVFIGLYSMIRFILSSLDSMSRLEKQREIDLAEKKEMEERRARILDSGKDLE